MFGFVYVAILLAKVDERYPISGIELPTICVQQKSVGTSFALVLHTECLRKYASYYRQHHIILQHLCYVMLCSPLFGSITRAKRETQTRHSEAC